MEYDLVYTEKAIFVFFQILHAICEFFIIYLKNVARECAFMVTNHAVTF